MSDEISVTFKKQALRSLLSLARNGRSKADVLREALALEAVYQKAIEDGSTVLIRTTNGVEHEIVRGDYPIGESV